MRRRTFLGFTAGLWPFAIYALDTAKVPRIGYLSPGSARLTPRDEAFLQGLRELGYVDGMNIHIEYRFAEGKFDRLAGLAAELSKLGVDAIVAVVTQASLAARDATKTIPVVMVAVSDPVASGLVTNLSRPGANITGTSAMMAEVTGKSLEVLKEIAPRIARMAVLWNPGNTVFQAQTLSEAGRAAKLLGLELIPFGVRDPEQLDDTFTEIRRQHVDALMVLADPLFIVHRARIVALVERERLPAVSESRAFADAGLLLAYGPSLEDQFHRAAAYVDKILRGVAPGDLPIEEPTKFDLVINLKAARALGLAVPPRLLSRADEVIE